VSVLQRSTTFSEAGYNTLKECEGYSPSVTLRVGKIRLTIRSGIGQSRTWTAECDRDGVSGGFVVRVRNIAVRSLHHIHPVGENGFALGTVIWVRLARTDSRGVQVSSKHFYKPWDVL
jgi:hypothetical protein